MPNDTVRTNSEIDAWPGGRFDWADALMFALFLIASVFLALCFGGVITVR